MPRNGSGSYSLPEAPFVPLTTISSAAMNSDLSDIGTALTGSLARDGQGGMTGTLPLADSGLNYANDTNTGLYRTASDAQALKCGGTDIISLNTSGATVTGSLSATTIKQNGFAVLPIGLGPLPWTGSYPPTGWILAGGQSLSRSSYPDLWTFAQSEIALGSLLYTNGNGSTTFTVPDLRGRVTAGKDDMGGTAANRLTNTTMSPNGVSLGATGGAQTITLQTSQIPAHSHVATDSGHSHVQDGDTIYVGGGPIQGGGSGALLNNNGGQTTDVGTANITVQNTGGSGAHGNVQPAIIINYIIFAGV